MLAIATTAVPNAARPAAALGRKWVLRDPAGRTNQDWRTDASKHSVWLTYVRRMTDQTQPLTASPRAFRLWIAAATATLFVIVATVAFMILTPDFDGWMAALASGFSAAFISGLGGIALWRDAHRAPPK